MEITGISNHDGSGKSSLVHTDWGAKTNKSSCFVEKNERKLKQITNLIIGVPGSETARIQELHILIGHLLCSALDEVTN